MTLSTVIGALLVQVAFQNSCSCPKGPSRSSIHWTFIFPKTESDAGQRISNVSQNKSSTGIGATPCITPQGTCWFHNRARLLLGAEAIRLQGIFLTDEQESSYSSGFLFDLAGNAFNTFCCSSKLCIGAQQSNRNKHTKKAHPTSTNMLSF